MTARTPGHGARHRSGSELGHPHAHLRAGAGCGLDDQPVLVAEHLAQPLVDVAQADRELAGASPASARRRLRLGVLDRRRRPRP